MIAIFYIASLLEITAVELLYFREDENKYTTFLYSVISRAIRIDCGVKENKVVTKNQLTKLRIIADAVSLEMNGGNDGHTGTLINSPPRTKRCCVAFERIPSWLQRNLILEIIRRICDSRLLHTDHEDRITARGPINECAK